MSDLWLSPEEVGELTGLKPTSYKAQCKALARMEIPFRPNAIGRPLVERSVIVKSVGKGKQAKRPNWDAISDKAA